MPKIFGGKGLLIPDRLTAQAILPEGYNSVPRSQDFHEMY